MEDSKEDNTKDISINGPTQIKDKDVLSLNEASSNEGKEDVKNGLDEIFGKSEINEETITV